MSGQPGNSPHFGDVYGPEGRLRLTADEQMQRNAHRPAEPTQELPNLTPDPTPERPVEPRTVRNHRREGPFSFLFGKIPPDDPSNGHIGNHRRR